METEKISVFKTLQAIDCSSKVEYKNKLTYLSWAWAWGICKDNYPEAFYTIYENKDSWNYHTDGNTAWVKTGITINGLEHIEYLPVLDNRNQSIPIEKLTSFNVNTSIQRSLTKALARHGLGLYIYAGEDLPMELEPQSIFITEEQVMEIEELIKKSGADRDKFLKAYQIAKVDDIPKERYNNVIATLNKRMTQNANTKHTAE